MCKPLLSEVQFEVTVLATEDKVVQNVLREVLEGVYEPTVMDCSYGFRPGCSAHGAVRALTRAVNELDLGV